jgi:O-antigen/teichoic acid export membrane protein
LLFGLPLVPHALAHWVLNFSDRVVLGAFADDAVVGVYNVAYQAAAPIMLVLIGVHQGVMPLYPRALEDGAVRARLATILTGHVHLASWLGATAALLAPPVLVALFPHAYRGAVEFVPWISLGYVFFGLYLIPMDSMTLMLGRSRWLWIPTALAATTNVAINLALVPRYGALASAAATAIAYGVLLAGVIVARQQTAGARISYDVRSMVVGVSWVILLAVGAGTLFPSLENVASIAGRVLVVAIAGAGLLAWQRWPSLAPERDHGASQAAETVHADERIEVKATHV